MSISYWSSHSKGECKLVVASSCLAADISIYITDFKSVGGGASHKLFNQPLERQFWYVKNSLTYIHSRFQVLLVYTIFSKTHILLYCLAQYLASACFVIACVEQQLLNRSRSRSESGGEQESFWKRRAASVRAFDLLLHYSPVDLLLTACNGYSSTSRAKLS